MGASTGVSGLTSDPPHLGSPLPRLTGDRANIFVLFLAVAYLLPAVVPGLGLDYPYFFIMVLVLLAWFSIKWVSVRNLNSRGSSYERILGIGLILGDYVENVITGSTVGLIDLLVIFLGAIILFYGIKSFKLFWVPATYGLILLAGYQIEIYLPNFVALQDWLAGVMVSFLNAAGIVASVTSAHLVEMNLPNGSPIYLDIASACTGVQGILAFGMLSTMALLDVKPKFSRLIPLFTIGFVGAFLVNILRLFIVFLTFEYLGTEAGIDMHFYFGYVVFIVWVLAFWAMAFRYLPARPLVVSQSLTAASGPTPLN